MEVLEFSGIVFGISAAAGFLGSLTGLGGGVVVTPALVLLLGVDLHYAMGASLVSVIATSSGAAAAYVKEGFSNVRVGMFLEIATTVGAVVGAHLVSVVPTSGLAIVFGAVLLYSAGHSVTERAEKSDSPPDPAAVWLKLDGTYPGPQGILLYHVQRVKAGFSLMFGAGILLGAARHRLRRREGDRYGPSDADSLQGIHYHQQLHDRRNCGTLESISAVDIWVRGLHAFSSLPWPEALIEIGLLALIANPLARVAFCLAAFAMERDRMYLCFTGAVLAVLLYSICTALL
jgi:hypothetical protein